MARRGKKMEHAEKLACMERVKSGHTDGQIAQATGWSVWTIRKWRRAYRKQGEAGLAPIMGRPRQGILSSYSAEMRKELENMRQGHPGWGPITLIEEISQLPAWFGQVLPSRSRVAAFLKEKEVVRVYERHAGVEKTALAIPLQAHDQWEMDAQGRQKVPGLGWIKVVNILDVVSRLKVASYPRLCSARLTWKDYQYVLRWAFFQYGLPKQISLDHDSTFFDNTCLSPFPSRLHLWLIALGVEVHYIEKPPPLEHARIERNHQTMSAQAILGQSWETPAALQAEMDRRRTFLNQIYPSRALWYQAPLEACPEAHHSGREYRPEWEEELLDMERVKALLATGKWFRETNRYGELFMSMQRYNASIAWKNTTVELTFDPHSLELVCHRLGCEQTKRFAIKGLQKTDLMGELASLIKMPSYQLALPLSREDWRVSALSHLQGGTTL